MKTIEKLYQVFNKYTTSGIHYCDCGCINIEDVKKLASKPLRKLEQDDIVSYHGSALHTWGDIEHYKHFLPRFLELYSENRNSAFIDLQEINIKLKHAEWEKWDEMEINAIKEFILEDWIQYINFYSAEIGIIEIENYAKFINLDDLLKLWNVTDNNFSIKNFVNLFYSYGNQILYESVIINKKDESKAFIKKAENKLILTALEKQYFEFEKTDSEYAEKASIVLQMIEQKNGR